MDTIDTDICVIGGGAAGLSVASTAALLGVPVVLIERHRLGGECLYHGCVPSKALIAAADLAHTVKDGKPAGIDFRTPYIDGATVMQRVRGVIDDIAPMDSIERYRALGVRIILGEARFTGPREVSAGDTKVRARRFVIATGSRPAIPDIPGLIHTPYLTTETAFDLTELPSRLAIVGGGAAGTELAQAYHRLGVAVSLIETTSILSGVDHEAARTVRQTLLNEGVQVLENCKVARVQPLTSGMALDLAGDNTPHMVNASHLLVATGRQAAFSELGLEQANIEYGADGIKVDGRQRTSNKRVFAIGDCCAGRPKLTHAASMAANVVIRNAVFRQRATFDANVLPHVIFTDPEIACVGLSEQDAFAQHKDANILRWPFSENDRAQTDHHTSGFVKILSNRKGKILGVTIVGKGAGELITPWTLAIQNGLTVEVMAAVAMPYPTRSEASKRAALQSLVPRLRSPWLKRLVRVARIFG